MNTQQADITLLTPKEQSILSFMYRFTTLTSRHIQTLLHHKDPSRINNIWLKTLLDQGYISKIIINGIPAYLLTAKARREVRKFLDKKTIRYPTQIHEYMLQTYLYSMNVYFSLNNSYADKDYHFIYFTPIDQLEKKLFPFLSPDGYFTYTRETHKKHFFIEIDIENQTTRTIKKKVTRYITYYHSFSWKKVSPKFFPAVCIVSKTGERTGIIKKLCEKVIEENNNIPIIFICSSFDQFSNGSMRAQWFVPFERKKFYI